MTEDRRYQDDEIRRIMDLALRRDEVESGSDVLDLPMSEGLTRSEVEQVGQGIGLSPARIAQAIVELEGRGEPLPTGTRLGLPTSVGHVVPLRRAPTDQEWARIVTELRSTFGDRGEAVSHGESREWSAGSLHAFVEPIAGGYRLRISESVDAGIIAAWLLGGFTLAFALMILVILLGKDDPGFRFVVPAFFALPASILIGGSMAYLPGWARRRQDQMELLASRVTALIESGEPEAQSEESAS
jgi:hypothetical protein